MTTEQAPRELTKFDYLLNAFEQASQAQEPAKMNYGDKRRALYAHVRDLESRALVASQAQPARCSYCDDTGDVHGIDGEWRGRCTCKFGQAQPAAERIERQLSELMRGLEMHPILASASPAQLFVIGRAIADQAKSAAEPRQDSVHAGESSSPPAAA